ncbi:histidine phosphatase family protein [Nocardia salmonicida]|uniref:histidine phosphatase family protein n=1 Tax=Nocardia salmonicida TaxID=53431 RepID=UPI0007C80D8B|nr:histidine phosphatase family protein [Nocardia salmonicida]MBC7299448.1 histidine phosphatase family protein [Nocardia sp.]
MSFARLILVRHGQAHCNVAAIVGGPRGCTGLTDLGRDQAARLAARLRAEHAIEPITAAYTSPLPRTRETADIIAEQLGLPISVETDLREPDYAQADGRPWTSVVADFGDSPALRPHRPIAPGAETWAAFLDRARAALAAILERHPEGTVLVIAHGETITAATYLFLNLSTATRATAAFAAHNGGITIWEKQPLAWTRPDDGYRWTLLQHNDTGHLSET